MDLFSLYKILKKNNKTMPFRAVFSGLYSDFSEFVTQINNHLSAYEKNIIATCSNSRLSY